MVVFWESEEGARRSGLGRGRDVRCGFWARAVVMAAADEGAVMSLMSFLLFVSLGIMMVVEKPESLDMFRFLSLCFSEKKIGQTHGIVE